jgi:hypothetical protein
MLRILVAIVALALAVFALTVWLAPGPEGPAPVAPARSADAPEDLPPPPPAGEAALEELTGAAETLETTVGGLADRLGTIESDLAAREADRAERLEALGAQLDRLRERVDAAQLVPVDSPEAEAAPAALAEDWMPDEEVAAALRPACVRVRIFGRRDRGEMPIVADVAENIANERPTLVGGYLRDLETVLVEDLVLHERFIRRIEVEAAGRVVAARVAARFLHRDAMLLRLGEPLPPEEVVPLTFLAGTVEGEEELDYLRVAQYAFGDDLWALSVTGAGAGYVRPDATPPFRYTGDYGLLVKDDGSVVGFAFSGRTSPAEGLYPWRGVAPGEEEPRLTAAEMDAAHEGIRGRLAQAAHLVRFRFRLELEEGEDAYGGGPFGGRHRRQWSGQDPTATELTATGFLVGPRRVLVPVQLPRALLMRLEEVTLVETGGDEPVERAATFAGALREYEAVLLDLEEDLPGALDLESDAAWREGSLFLTARIDHDLGRRREVLAYDRCQGFFREYRGRRAVWTRTNEADGSVAFTPDGRLLGLSVASRIGVADGEDWYAPEPTSMFRPLAVLRESLAAEDAVDPTLRPVAQVMERRIVTLGVEWQGLDAPLARALGVEKGTRGGEVGLLVAHVYPGSPAAEALAVGDILLGLDIPGRQEPVELRPETGPGAGGIFEQFMAHFGSIPEEQRAYVMENLPPPWPDRRNLLTGLLTQVGAGKEVTVHYLQDGERRSFTFTTSDETADYRSAPKHRSRAYGLTVRALTPEVRRFFRMSPEAPGVVVSRVETGSPAAVAGIHRYELVTRVNGAPVADLDAFVAALERTREEASGTLELSLTFLGKDRLVKLGPPAASGNGSPGGAEETPEGEEAPAPEAAPAE